MKKILIASLLCYPFALLAQSGPFVIKGKLGNLNAPATIFLNYHTTEGKNYKDSSVLHNGSFEIKGNIQSPVPSAQLYLKRYKGDFSNTIIIWIEPGITTITGTDSLKPVTISGSALNEADKNLREALTPFNDSIYKLINTAGVGIFKDRNSAAYASYQAKSESLTKEKLPVYRSFIVANPNSLVSIIALQTYGDLKYNTKRGVSEVEPLFNGLSARVRNSVLGKIYKGRLDGWKTAMVGKAAQDFTLFDQEEKPVKFSQFKGKYVLLDFWASWCHPCRHENPTLVKAYELYKEKNFTIVSVTIDTKKFREQWLKAIKQDGLTWTQLTGDIENNEARQKYAVQSIPDNFLINPEGIIIAKGLRGEELISTLKEILH